jgi:hypothetical protein
VGQNSLLAQARVSSQSDWWNKPFFSDTLSRSGRYAYSIGLFTVASVGVHAGLIQTKGIDWGKAVRAERFVLAYTMPPQWDNDTWHYNFVVHPVMGYIAYTGFRNRGGTMLGGFVSTTIASSMYEYVFASWTQRPSIQDLIITPVLGSLLGETSHQIKRAVLKNQYLSTFEKCVLIAVDPIEFCNKKFNFNNYLPKNPVAPTWL